MAALMAFTIAWLWSQLAGPFWTRRVTDARQSSSEWKEADAEDAGSDAKDSDADAEDAEEAGEGEGDLAVR